MATFLVYGQFYPYVNPVPRSGSNNRSQAIAILASVLCKKMRLTISTNNGYGRKIGLMILPQLHSYPNSRDAIASKKPLFLKSLLVRMWQSKEG